MNKNFIGSLCTVSGVMGVVALARIAIKKTIECSALKAKLACSQMLNMAKDVEIVLLKAELENEEES